MKKLSLALAAGALALSLGACSTVGGNNGLTPDQLHQIMMDAHNAGCGGRVDIDAGAATGQVGGEAHIQFGLHGDCPAANGPVTAPTPMPAPTPKAAPAPAAK